jgi:hypothetical protein
MERKKCEPLRCGEVGEANGKGTRQMGWQKKRMVRKKCELLRCGEVGEVNGKGMSQMGWQKKRMERRRTRKGKGDDCQLVQLQERKRRSAMRRRRTSRWEISKREVNMNEEKWRREGVACVVNKSRKVRMG